jgi:hypothetical protein
MTNTCFKILTENAKTFTERQVITTLTESEVQSVNNTMVSNLYKSAIEKAHIDFDDIPQSKGDVTRYLGYKSLTQSIEILKEISSKNDTKIPELEIVENALNNIVMYREAFEKGFRLNKEFVELQYNTLVYACVESVSVLISSYVDFVKRPDKIDFVIVKDPKRGGSVSIQNLEKFNLTVKKGDFSKTINAVINSGKEGLIGVDDIIIPALILGGVISLVPMIRELMFLFYYSRMKVSDYLKQQAALIEINKQSVLSSSVSIKEKNAILKKQSEKIHSLQSLSDKIKVDKVMSENKSNVEISKQNKSWSIGEIQSQAATNDLGFQLM